MSRRLYRRRENRVLGGVAAGLADYLHVDVALVRLVFVLAALAEGAGVLVYLILWLVMPEEETGEEWR